MSIELLLEADPSEQVIASYLREARGNYRVTKGESVVD